MNSDVGKVAAQSRLEKGALRGRKRPSAAAHRADAVGGLRVERRLGARFVLAFVAQALNDGCLGLTAGVTPLNGLRVVHAHHPVRHPLGLALEAVVGGPDRQLRLKPGAAKAAAGECAC